MFRFLKSSLMIIMIISFNFLFAQSSFLTGAPLAKEEALSVKEYNGLIYSVGFVSEGLGNFGYFSCIDPTTQTLIFSTRLDINSELKDFVPLQDNSGFIVIGQGQEYINETNQTQSLACIFDNNGVLQNSKTWEFDTNRESFEHIIENPNPIDNNYPYYITGIRINNAFHPIDDYIFMSIDKNLNFGSLNKIYSIDFNNMHFDDQFNQKLLNVNYRIGNTVLIGNIDSTGGDESRAAIVELDNNGDVEFSRYYPNFSRAKDLIHTNTNDGFIFIGNTGYINVSRFSFGNFIGKLDTDYNLLYSFSIIDNNNIQHIDITSIVEMDGFYYVSTKTFNRQVFIHKIRDTGNEFELIHSINISDDDDHFNEPRLSLFQNDKILYKDDRIPAGHGINDVFIALLNEDLTSCITKDTIFDIINLNEVATETTIHNIDTNTYNFYQSFNQSNNGFIVNSVCETPTDTIPSDSACATILEDTTTCITQEVFSYTFEFINNSEETITHLDVLNETLGTIAYSEDNLNIPSGGTYEVIIPEIMIIETDLCFRLNLFTESNVCCHIEYCITPPDCEPCQFTDIMTTTIEHETETCCHSIDIINNVDPQYFSFITANILTPNVTFNNVGSNSGWNVNPTANNQGIRMTPNNGTIPLGLNEDIANFCLEGITNSNQTPQMIEFIWYTIDGSQTNPFVAVCRDTLIFDCEPTFPCATIDMDTTLCLLEKSKFFYGLQFTDHSGHNITSVKFEVITPNDICVNGSTLGTYLTPTPFNFNNSDSTYRMNVTLEDCGINWSAGAIIHYKLIYFDEKDPEWCCHSDTMTVEVPNCEEEVDCSCQAFKETPIGFDYQGNSDCSQIILTPFGLETACTDTLIWTTGAPFPNGNFIGSTTGTTSLILPSSYFNTGIYMVVYHDEPNSNERCSKSAKKFTTQTCLHTPFSIRAKERKLFPNPTNGKFNIEVDETITSIQVQRMDGKIIISKESIDTLNTSMPLDLTGQAEGIYFVKIINNKGEIETLKVIKTN